MPDRLTCSDPLVCDVMEKMRRRSERGIAKYGTNMLRDDLSKHEWLIHAQEEAMDLAIYLERLLREEERCPTD